MTTTDKLNELGKCAGWNNWESGFLRSMSYVSDPETLSVKQIACIDRMYAKIA